MPGLPEITLRGTVTADPELRFTPNGAPVANFTVACNDRRYDRQSGGYVDGEATFMRCQVWRQQAENVAESVTRGMRVVVVGVVKQRSFETRDGEKRTVFEVDAHEVGASLLFAQAQVRKATRSSGDGGGGHGSSRGNDDPWGSAPPADKGGYSDDEPPF